MLKVRNLMGKKSADCAANFRLYLKALKFVDFGKVQETGQINSQELLEQKSKRSAKSARFRMKGAQ